MKFFMTVLLVMSLFEGSPFLELITGKPTPNSLSLSLERYCNPERLKKPHSHLSTADTHLNYVGSNIQWATRSKPLALAVIFYRKQINT